MFDIVAPHQHQAPAAIHGGGVDHGQPRHPSAIGVGTQAVAGESANQPGGDAGSALNGARCEDELSPACFVPANNAFVRFCFVGRRIRNETKNDESVRLALFLNVHGKICLGPTSVINQESLWPKTILDAPHPLRGWLTAASWRKCARLIGPPNSPSVFRHLAAHLKPAVNHTHGKFLPYLGRRRAGG